MKTAIMALMVGAMLAGCGGGSGGNTTVIPAGSPGAIALPTFVNVSSHSQYVPANTYCTEEMNAAYVKYGVPLDYPVPNNDPARYDVEWRYPLTGMTLTFSWDFFNGVNNSMLCRMTTKTVPVL